MVHPNTCGFSSAISWWSVLRSATHNQGQATPSYINASPSACIRSLYAQGTAPVALAREKAEAIGQLVRGEDPRAGRVSITPKTFKDCMDGLLNCLLPHWRERPKTADRLRSPIWSVIDDAIAHEWDTAGNPACWKGRLEKVIPRRQKLQRGHHAALAYPYERYRRPLDGGLLLGTADVPPRDDRRDCSNFNTATSVRA